MVKWIQTGVTFQKFFPLNPEPEKIDIRDIARSLSIRARFCGHSEFPISVAQHSILVAIACPPDARLQLAGLLHDASEAYLGDLVSPLKKALQDDAPELYKGIKAVDDYLQDTIWERYGLDLTDHERRIVHQADLRALATEMRDYQRFIHPDWEAPDAEPLESYGIPCEYTGKVFGTKQSPWGQLLSEQRFIWCFQQLMDGKPLTGMVFDYRAHG